jgi:hypothetical protein
VPWYSRTIHVTIPSCTRCAIRWSSIQTPNSTTMKVDLRQTYRLGCEMQDQEQCRRQSDLLGTFLADAERSLTASFTLRGAFSSSSCTPSSSPSSTQGGCHASIRILGRRDDGKPETACGKCNLSHDKREGHHTMSVDRASRIRTGCNTDKRASGEFTSHRLLVP